MQLNRTLNPVDIQSKFRVEDSFWNKILFIYRKINKFKNKITFMNRKKIRYYVSNTIFFFNRVNLIDLLNNDLIILRKLYNK